MSTPAPVKIIAGMGAASAVLGVALWINLGGDDYPDTGDCVSQTGPHALTIVPCSPAAPKSGGADTNAGNAYYEVLARFAGVDANQCDTVAGTARAFVEYPSDQSPFVLCAGPVR